MSDRSTGSGRGDASLQEEDSAGGGTEDVEVCLDETRTSRRASPVHLRRISVHLRLGIVTAHRITAVVSLNEGGRVCACLSRCAFSSRISSVPRFVRLVHGSRARVRVALQGRGAHDGVARAGRGVHGGQGQERVEAPQRARSSSHRTRHVESSRRRILLPRISSSCDSCASASTPRPWLGRRSNPQPPLLRSSIGSQMCSQVLQRVGRSCSCLRVTVRGPRAGTSCGWRTGPPLHGVLVLAIEVDV